MSEVHKACQTLFSKSGEVLFLGEWDSKILYRTLTGSDDSFWKNKTVLDIGANTCGLGLEIARSGGKVTCLEPDPYNNNLTLVENMLEEIVKTESLKLETHKLGLFDAFPRFQNYDVVMCLGLLYHFRYPQYILDYLSTLKSNFIFVSTQIHPGTGLNMVNRVDESIFKKDFIGDRILSGWHPTHALFERMLKWAGFSNVTLLTDIKYTFPQKQKGLTNSGYYKAERVSVVEPMSALKEYYPR